MEYVQEHVATFHDLADATPEPGLEDTAVVVPMTARDRGTPAAERTLATLAGLDPATVYVPLRADPADAAATASWLNGFDAPVDPLWCDAPGVEDVLASAGLDGARGKGRDVWIAFGAARRHDRVVVHDADATTYDEHVVRRLAFPLTRDYAFVKGYYARVEDDRLYGRLFRLLVRPLLDALAAGRDAPVLDYLRAFRYALAGEFAATGDALAHMRVQPGWGLEVGTLGELFRLVGPEGSAQVDLGVHRHDHRPVEGAAGLADMSEAVAGALLRACEDAGLDVGYADLPARYERAAGRSVARYADDAAFNGLDFDRAAERDQVAAYADTIAPPGPDERLPAWADCGLDAERLLDVARTDPAEGN
jgi:glucosyl-3-phosphoglycerate synthase